MKKQHTPGPWIKIPQSDGSILTARRYETGNQMNPTGLRIVGFTMARESSLQEDEANADLIAAGPELLELAMHIQRCIHLNGFVQIQDGSQTNAELDAAITKATGGAA